MKLTNFLFPFLKEEPEEKEEAAAEEASAEEAPAEEAPAEEAPSDEPPAEEAPAEEAPTEEPKKQGIPSILFALFKKLIHNKVFSEVMILFSIALALSFLFLTYGQITKAEHSVSFETIYAQLESRKVAEPFSNGDMDKLVSFLYTKMPTENYKTDFSENLRKQTTQTLKKEYEHLFKKRAMKLLRVTCEYQKEKEQTNTRLVCTCYFTFSETEDFCLILKKRASNSYEISLSDPKGNTSAYKKINALFSYITYSYENPLDYEIAKLLTDKKPNYKKAASYFTTDATNPEKATTYQKIIAKRFRRLARKKIQLDQVFFSPYSYDQKKKEKTSSLILRFTDLENGTPIILYQPVLIGLYGYQPLKNTALCSGEIPSDISNEICQIFSY